MTREIMQKLTEAEAMTGEAPVIGERIFRPTHTYLTAAGRRIKVEAVSTESRWNGTRVTVLTGRGDVWECHISKLTAIERSK